MARISGEVMILIGVAHGSSIKNALIFDTSTKWVGTGNVNPVNLKVETALRSHLINGITKEFGRDAAWVSDTIHQREHSLASFTPWLQKYNPNAFILPILVGNMDSFETHLTFAKSLAILVNQYMSDNGYHWGGGEKGVQLLMSNDCVHYGNDGWGGSNLAPFGCIEKISYQLAAGRDEMLIKHCLCDNKEGVDIKKLQAFYSALHEGDCQWCGRESVPFGVLFLLLTANSNNMKLKGEFYSYTSSLTDSLESKYNDKFGEENSRCLTSNDTNEKSEYIQPTNMANLRHWVGYTAVGFRFFS